MKKLVTIRKAGKGEKPGFINKTAKFLRKAEMGTEVQSGSGEYNEKILEYVAEQILEQGQDPKTVYETLIESKIEPEVAAEHIKAILSFQQNMQQQQTPENTEETAETDTAYSQAADEVEEDLAANYGYYDSSGQGAQLAADDEEEEEANAYDDQMVTDIVNNEWTGQDGGIIDDYIVNNYLPTSTDFSQDDYNAYNYKTGGKVSKRKFMRNVMSELKKAREGMQQESESPDQQKFDMTDTLLLDRNKKKDNFVKALSKTTQEAKDKEKAEQMWQKQQAMMQQPQMQMDPSIPMLNKQDGGDTEHPYHHLAQMQEANQATMSQPMNTMLTARGGMAMPSPRQYRKMHRQVSRMLPNIYLDPNIKASELDVRKTGIFGRPKQYSIKFQGNQGITPGWAHGTLLLGLPGGANMMPNVYNPFGMFGSASSYGGGYTKGIVETKKVLDTGHLRPVSRTPNQPGVPYGGYSDNPAPAGTTIGTDAQGNRIAIAPAGSGTTPENETWQNYNPTVVPGMNPIVAPTQDFNPEQSANVGENYIDEMIKKYPPTIGQDHDDWMASWNYSVGFAPDHRKWDGTQWKEMGGFVDPNNPELYKFIYGGGDNMFEDDMNTINTADPYFGRMYDNGGPFKIGNNQFTITNQDQIVSNPPNQFQSPAYQQFNPNATSGSNYAAFLELQKRGLAQGPYDPGKSYDISNTNPGTTTNTITTTQQRPSTTSNQVVTNFSNIPGYRSNGLLDTLFSANVMPEYLGTWSKIKGIKTANGQPFTGFNANTVLNEIDVRRSGLRGQPKRYTLKFNQYTDPRDANKITLNPMENRMNDPNDPSKVNVQGKPNSDKALQPRGTYRDFGLFDQMRIRANERQADRRTSYEPDVNPKNEPLSNEEMLKSQGRVWDEQQKKWLPRPTLTVNDPNATRTPGISPSQGADLVTGTPGISVGTLPSQEKVSTSVGSLPSYLNRADDTQTLSQNPVTFGSPKSAWDPTNLIRSQVEPKSAPQSNLGPVGFRSTGMINQSPEEIRRAYASGTSDPTIIQRGNTTYINAAGEPIDLNDPIYSDEYAYGGYIPSYMAYGGLTTFNPGGGVSYTNNPAFVGKSNIDLLSENGDIPVANLEPSSFWSDSQSFNKPQPSMIDNCTEDQKKDPNSPCYEGYTIDPNQQISDTLKKDMMDSNEVEIDVKNKNVYGADLEAGLAVGNKLASIYPAIQNRREANKLLGNKKLRKTADALYANNPAGDPWQSKGQYSVSGSTYGLFDPRNAGQINYSGRSQYGGSIYKEGGVAYMTADELKKFMEEGGEIEFI